MLVLAIDTTNEHGGVALFRDLACLASVANTGTSGYSVTLFQSVESVLREAGAATSEPPLNLRDIELFAVANGPGSFTGLRTGIAATQGWATALGRPVQGVSILAAMAHESQAETEWVAAIMDARRAEFYFGLFRRTANRDGDTLEPAGDGRVLTAEALRTLLRERVESGAALTGVVRECDEAAQCLRREHPESLPWANVSDSLLGSIARLALEAQRRGKLQSPAELDACYIRRSDAELNWRF